MIRWLPNVEQSRYPYLISFRLIIPSLDRSIERQLSQSNLRSSPLIPIHTHHNSIRIQGTFSLHIPMAVYLFGVSSSGNSTDWDAFSGWLPLIDTIRIPIRNFSHFAERATYGWITEWTQIPTPALILISIRFSAGEGLVDGNQFDWKAFF